VRGKIFRQTDVEIIEQDQLMEKEIEDGIIPDPNAPIDPMTGQPINGTTSMDLGKPVMEPDLESQGFCCPSQWQTSRNAKGWRILINNNDYLF
jgi:hypothetical protein